MMVVVWKEGPDPDLACAPASSNDLPSDHHLFLVLIIVLPPVLCRDLALALRMQEPAWLIGANGAVTGEVANSHIGIVLVHAW